ncbi:deoxyUTP pyrophosphatase [Prosthecochloris aestuarii DSM 271]|uniref:dUTP diphosphatase n=1 Tax=Prosthecochloris aestuarii (strain DSM 271 / SK 413) TaxID=290512 RepID=B4S642_PROA2|nr:dUTP pyrophosphatase [Prosthecochloris aestuarii]ACF45693.1 deoxyUTP pyrophosphatase [Prosthecochloris aestuarii DSM 271]
MELKNHVIYFAKNKSGGIIPKKREEDAGYDFYPCFDEQFIIINPNEIVLVPTGISSAFNSNFVLIVKERSSTGAKGMSVRMGVIDSGYRGEIMIGINNTNSKPIKITKGSHHKEDNYIIHPYNKAIAQGILLQIPKMNIQEVSYDELLKFESARKKSFLGASGK